MRAAIFAVLLAACGASDPCAGVAGTCVALTVRSSTVAAVDELDINAFGTTRQSKSTRTNLPVQVALVAPAGATGQVTIGVNAFLDGALVGFGSTDVTIVAGHASGTVDLQSGVIFDAGPGVDLATGDLAQNLNCMAPTPNQCGNICTNVQTDPQNCFMCGHACNFPNAAASCMAGVCTMGACAQDYGDCVNGTSDGCETFLKGSDATNCGGCGVTCKVGQVCVSGGCTENQVTCSTAGITCHQAGCYQAGRYSISAGGGIVVDLNNARRLWTRATHGPASHSTAQNDCATLAIEGVNGWRLPIYSELSSTFYMTGGLQGCPTCDPAIDQAAFNDTPVSSSSPGPYYWSADVNTATGGFETAFFCDGRKNYPNPSPTLLPYRCVHDPLP